MSYLNVTALKISYMDKSGAEISVRIRMALDGKNKFHWKKGSKPFLYGLNRLDQNQKEVVLVEGESDCHTLWYHGINAVGLPGASSWKENRDAKHFDNFDAIYVVLEADQGGTSVLKWLKNSSIKDKVQIVTLEGYKDVSALHIADPTQFLKLWRKALRKAVPWHTYEKRNNDKLKKELWRHCKELAQSTDIMAEFITDIRRAGLTGEEKNAKIIFLALVSRLLEKIVSLAVKGPSSGGKSFSTEKVLSFFPDSAFYALTATVEYLNKKKPHGVSFKDVGDHLGLDKSSAQRRCQVALKAGYLKNLEERYGKPAQLQIGEPMPEKSGVLPSPQKIKAFYESGCTVAS